MERLIVSLEARTAAFEKALNRANGVANRSARSIETRFAKMNRNLSTGLGEFARGFAGALAAGFSVQAVGQLVEASQRISNALKSAGLAGEQLTNVYEQLFAAAQKNAVPIESLVTLYSKLALSQKELGVSQAELISFTDTIATALRAGGQSAEQASGALLQLSQALGGGVVRAEEFNSILEGAPSIIQAAAAGIKEAGGSVGKLRQLMIDGKVSSKAFFDGIEAGRPILEQRLVGAEKTVSQSFIRLRNVLIDTAGDFNKSTKAAETFGSGIDAVANAVNEINFDGLISNIQQVIDRFNQGVTSARGFFQEIGRLTGLDILGKIAAGNSGFGSVAGGAFTITSQRGIEDRINDAFGQTVETATTLTEEAIRDAARRRGVTVTSGGKTGRLPAATPVIKPVSLDDYALPETAGGTKGAAASAKRAADKIAREAQRKAEKFAEAIGRQAGVAVDAAETLLGQHEKTDRGNINAFLKRGGVDLDAATTAWCAAFVNSALAQVGIKGSGSNVATDFANWGKAVGLSDIQRGDVLVQNRGRTPGQTGGHVGFATGQLRATAEGIQQIELLSGNASNKVKTEWVDASSVVARRAADGFAIATESLSHLTLEADAATAAQKRLAEQSAEVGYMLQDAMGGLIRDLVAGKDASEALSNALASVADQLLEISLNKLFSGFGTVGAPGGGGLFGGMIIPGILHKGGVAGSDGYGHGRAVSPSVFAGARRYHKGGVAGLQAGEVPAILQRGEVVIPRGGGGAQKGMHITVGVSADNNGNLMPFVESVSERKAAQVTQQGIGAYDKQLNRSIGGKMASAQARQF